MARVVAYKRAEFFSAESTVDDVRRQYAEKPGGDGLLALARAIKASDLRLRAYFAAVPATTTTEQVLHDLGIIPLNEPSEVATFRQRYMEGLPAVEEALREADGAPDSRSMALCFVTGSSGSGKTFFSLSALREFRNDLGNPLSLVLYLRAGILKVDYSDVGSAPGAIVRAVQTLLNKYLTRSRKRKVDFRRGEKLAMHVCLVLDECSAPRVGPFFEHDNMSTIQELIAMLESEVADSVTLVAAGTGTLGSTYDSTKEAHFFRMKQWGPEDLRSVLGHFQAKRRMGKVTTDTLHLKAHETTDTLANAINAHPWLAALTTNGRSTYFLCDTVANLSQQFPGRKVSWYVALGEWTPSLVERVLYRYTSSNGLYDLEAGAKATVAALAFGALDRATSVAALPDFGGLDASERRAVELLLESNVVVADDRTPRLLSGEALSVSVTPAVTVVLYGMVGITARTVAGWKAEEQGAALFAARRWILHQLREYEARAAAALDADSQQHLELKWGFGTLLTKLRLLRLERPFRHINGNCTFPMVTKNHVLVNGDKASCADVIAPYTFLQCMYSADSDQHLLVDLAHELSKCGLLHGSDDRLLRGLFAVWRGAFDKSFRVVDPPGPLVDATGSIALQRSPAFPENFLKYREAFDAVQYASIDKSSSLVLGDARYRLPPVPDDVSISFILVTNVKAIKLSLPGIEEPIVVVASLRKGDMQINHPALTAFLKSEARVNVAVNVLFTGIFEE
jgi:hypothetical protein